MCNEDFEGHENDEEFLANPDEHDSCGMCLDYIGPCDPLEGPGLFVCDACEFKRTGKLKFNQKIEAMKHAYNRQNIARVLQVVSRGN